MGVHILSQSNEPFEDRREAGRQLARELEAYRELSPVVVGVPRGGVVVAHEIALQLQADLDIVLAHKLRTPGRAELAMGSVTEDGRLWLNEYVIRELNVGDAYIQQEKAQQMEEIRRRTGLFRQVSPKVPLAGRTVIVTDDGVATGATTQAAFWAVRLEDPERLIAALPVAPDNTVRRLAEDVDEMICLRTPPLFSAVGQFYRSFEAVEDEEVLRILKAKQGRGGGR